MGPGRVGGRLDGFSELRLFGGFVSVVVESCSTKCKFNNGIDHLCVWFPLFVDVVVSRSPEMPTGLSFDPQQLPMGPKASYRTSGTIDMI